MRYIEFTQRQDIHHLLACMVHGFRYFGGVTESLLTDRMKTVLLDMETGTPQWHPRFQELVSALGISPRVCRPYTPQTKGKVERSVGVVKHDFWPGVQFTDLDDLNRQADVWCRQVNARVQRTTGIRPVERWAEEGLRPLPERPGCAPSRAVSHGGAGRQCPAGVRAHGPSGTRPRGAPAPTRRL